jgi:hypothetical protein
MKVVTLIYINKRILKRTLDIASLCGRRSIDLFFGNHFPLNWGIEPYLWIHLLFLLSMTDGGQDWDGGIEQCANVT